MPPFQTAVKLTRDEILNGNAFSRFTAHDGHPPVWTDAQLRESLRATLAEAPEPGADVWLFGYGSLIWNPAFRHAETRLARIQGWHRRFCIWTSLMRGSLERPGLVLGLDSGGSCKGVAFRIPAADVDTELAIVWRREMMNGAYVPRWIDVHCPGAGVVRGLTFTVNRRHAHYAGRLADESVAEALATATGCFGPCAEYFFSTLHALNELGIDDARLRALRDRVLVLKHADARHADYAGSGV